MYVFFGYNVRIGESIFGVFSVVAFSRVVVMGIVYFAMSSFLIVWLNGDVERVWRVFVWRNNDMFFMTYFVLG